MNFKMRRKNKTKQKLGKDHECRHNIPINYRHLEFKKRHYWEFPISLHIINKHPLLIALYLLSDYLQSFLAKF